MSTNFITAVNPIARLRMLKATPENSIAINGNVYRKYTWATLEKDARTPGIQVVYNGSEAF